MPGFVHESNVADSHKAEKIVDEGLDIMKPIDGRVPVASTENVPTPSRGGRSGGNRASAGKTSILEDVMKRRGVDEAWGVLEDMQQNGSTTDKYTVSRMLMKTVGDNRSRLNPSRIYRAIGIVEKFVELQPNDVDEVLLNALLDTCCRLKDLNRLESIMQRMRTLNITPSPVTLGILVKTYGQAGNIEKVLHVWDEMDKQRLLANAVTYGCMIDACVKCNRLDKAIEIFNGMRESGKHRNTILYTTLIKGFGLEKDLNSALELFREMPGEGVPYNTITYNSIIDSCVKVGDLQTAESLLHEIIAPSSLLEPDLITFSTLLKGYCNVGDLDQALQLAECIKSRGLKADELVYNTLMDGCVKANDVTAGVGLFEEMVQMGLRPSAITHSILLRLYQRGGYEEQAAEAVAQLYHHHGIERPLGGDRGKGHGRRQTKQSSPLTRSPTSSPTHSFGGYHEHQATWWNEAVSSHGYDAFTNPSCSSSPCSSPGHSVSTNGFCMPPEAVRGIPSLPGMSSESPYGGSLTPMGASMNGCGSPQMQQVYAGHSQNQFASMPYQTAPDQMSSFGQVLPHSSLPPFPFANGTTPNHSMDGSSLVNNFPQQPQPQVFFENFATSGNQVHTASGRGANPFCL